MPTTVDIESQRMRVGTTPVRKLYQGTNLRGTRIAELFANGEQGVWYDPSDFSTLFQDAAGTIPVTAVEQPVGRMLDKSGRGNHASQPTTTARPILRQDENGKHYLYFDGVDDWMQTASSMDLSGTSEVVTMAAVKVPASKTTRGTVFELGTSYASSGCFGMETPMFSAAAVGVGYRGNGSETAKSISSTDSSPISIVFGASLYLNDPAFQLRADGNNKQMSSVSTGSG
ncbi:MAG: hypothetical protein RJA36_3827, partial [Pseudomonadota bacterium]